MDVPFFSSHSSPFFSSKNYGCPILLSQKIMDVPFFSPVFHYRDKPVGHMLTSAWKRARVRVGLPQVRVHDLKHTFGRRLRAAGVNFEDRQDLLGHRSGRITTHYSAAELTKLIEAAESVCDRGEGKPELVVLRRLNFG
jgi:integrase